MSTFAFPLANIACRSLAVRTQCHVHVVLTGVGCKYIQAGRCNAESTYEVRVKQGMRLKREFAPPAALPGVQLPLGTLYNSGLTTTRQTHTSYKLSGIMYHGDAAEARTRNRSAPLPPPADTGSVAKEKNYIQDYSKELLGP